MKVKKKLRVVDSEAKLPKTRKELFNIIFKEDYYLIMDSGLVSFLFSIPLIIVFATALLLLSNAPTDGINEYVFPILFWCGLLSIPAFMIRYLGRISLFPVFKKRSFNESDFFSSLFLSSLKEYWKRGLLLGLIVGLVSFLSINALAYILVFTSFWLWRSLAIGAVIIIYFIVYMSCEYFMSVTNYYELSFSDCFKNSASFALMDLFVSLLCFVILVVIPFVSTFFISFMYYIWILLFTFIIDGLSITFITLRSHYLFDLTINQVHYKEMYRKGLLKED